MSRFKIVEQNEVARLVIEQVISAHEFSDFCIIQGSDEASEEESDLDEIDLKKPIRLGVFLDRLSYAQWLEGAAPVLLGIGPYDLDTAHNTLILREGGRSLRLTEKETAILQLLYDANGQVVARETLLDEVWGYVQGVETHTLETHIYRLRQKIEDDAGAPLLLLTEENGYRLGD